MNAFIMAMDTVAALLLSALATKLAIAPWRAPHGPFRRVSLGGAAVYVLLLVASLHKLLTVTAHVGIVAPHWIDWLLGPMAVIRATLAAVVAASAVVVAHRYWHRLGRAHDGESPHRPAAVGGPREASLAHDLGVRGP